MSFYQLRGTGVQQDLYYCDDCGVVIYEPCIASAGTGQTDRLDRHEYRCPERES